MWGWKEGVLICCFIVAQPDRQDDTFTLVFTWFLILFLWSVPFSNDHLFSEER